MNTLLYSGVNNQRSGSVGTIFSSILITTNVYKAILGHMAYVISGSGHPDIWTAAVASVWQ